MKEIFEGLRNLIIAGNPTISSIYRTGMNMTSSSYPRVVLSFEDEIVDSNNTTGYYDEFNVYMYAKEYDLDTIDDILYPIINSLDKKEIVTNNGDTLPVEYLKGSKIDGFTEDKNEPFYRVGFIIPKIY